MNPNAITGLASKLNTPEIIDKFIKIEKRKVIPIEKRAEEKIKELESWDAVRVELEKLHGIIKDLTSNDLWEAKKVDVSDPTVISATVTRRAKPGKHKIAVDSVALAHQITSQGFETPEVNVGQGKIQIRVGNEVDSSPYDVRINDSNNTLEGVKDAINDSGADVEAFVIKTGSAEKPYQLMLTSKNTGEEGRIHIKVDLSEGTVEPPSYDSSFEETSTWKGLRGTEPQTIRRGAGASTPITGVVGNYEGQEDKTYTFTATQAGTVNSEQGVIINWDDGQGNTGTFELNKFNYTPGRPIPFADGLSVLFSDGEVVTGDSFKVQAFAEKSDFMWWLTPEQRASTFAQPTDWAYKDSRGGLQVKGKYEGEDDQYVIFRVEGSGQVGGPSELYLHYEFTETGETGKLNIAHPYLGEEVDPSALESATAFDYVDGEGLFDLVFKTVGGNPRQLAIAQGLTIEVPPGILRDGDTTVLELKAPVPDTLWWLPEDQRGITGEIDQNLSWEPYLDDEGNPVGQPNVADGLLSALGEISTSAINISGYYTEDLPTTYTFEVLKEGSVGITRVLEVEWTDDFGNSGILDFGEGYDPEKQALDFGAGLKVNLGKGKLVEGDTFTIDTRTATVQKPQDAVLRLGASELGGGIEIRRPTNTIDDIIEGVELELLSSSEDPVTITVSGDTDKARESLRDFVEAYNAMNATILEVTKFDPGTNTAAPLLSDRNLANFQNEIANTTISSVAGLPKSTNMLFSIGLRLDDKGNMSLDESKLNEKISDDFGTVADLFRNAGESDNPSITFVGMSEKTAVNPTGYAVDIQQAATRGTYVGERLPEVLEVNETNDQIIVVANGRSSEPIEIRQGSFTPEGLAKEIQNKLQNDKVLGQRRIQVTTTEDNRLKFISGNYGSRSTISIEPVEDKDIDSLGLLYGESTQGLDVVGTIDGVEAQGRGQLLSGSEGTDMEGLRLFVTLNEEQVTDRAEGQVIITRGIGEQLDMLLKKLSDPITGDIKTVTKDIAQQAENFNQQIKRLNERIEEKRSRLQIKFAKLESTMGRLNAEKDYLGKQLDQLGGGKGDK